VPQEFAMSVWTVYLITLGGLMVAQITPGPNLLAVAGAALGQGLAAALYVTLGVATAIFIYVTAMSLGLSAVLAFYPPLLIAMKFIGGAYLSYLAFRALRSAARGNGATITAQSRTLAPLAAWRRGLLVNLTNPKSAMFWAALTTFMFGSGLSTWQVLAFAPIGFCSALAVYGTYSLLFSREAIRALYQRFTRALDAAFGAVFGFLGAGLIWDGANDVVNR
jgi:threonine/homoserine/homoserine lactone efflux protein